MSAQRDDLAFSRLLHKWPDLDIANADVNEATTRLRAIDVMVFDVLGWDRTHVDVERYCRAEGYADYVFTAAGSAALVLEAKRMGTDFILPQRKFKGHPVKFGLLAAECPDAGAALRQALGYAAGIGSRYIAISNGRQWIIALTYVSGEDVLERQVLVFESLTAVKERFGAFWNAFSAPGVTANEVYATLLARAREPAPPKLSSTIVGYPLRASRNVFQNELSHVLEIVWQTMEQEEGTIEFLNNCYVPPPPHQDVIELARELLSRRRDEDSVLVQQRIDSIDQLPGKVTQLPASRPFVILGEIGHGKTSFLKYLRLVAAKDSLAKYIQIDLDFLDRPDTADQIETFIYDKVEQQLRDRFCISITEDAFVRGVLHWDLMELRKSPRGKLFSDEPDRYKEYELSFIENKIADRHSYLTRVITHLKSGRNYSVALFFDNLDRRTEEIQERAFLKASAVARDWASLVFVCLRPGTYYRSQQRGVLDSIAPIAFTVSRPDLGLVLKRRFTYAARIASGEGAGRAAFRAHPSKNVAFDLPSAAAIFESCVFAARKERGIVPMLEAVSNGNIRSLLDFARKILSSGYLDTKKILQYIEEGTGYVIPDFEGVKTLLYGDYQHYDPIKSNLINLFDIEHADVSEHFLRYLVLHRLMRVSADGPSRGFLSVQELQQYLFGMGFGSVDVDREIQYLHRRSCLRGPLGEETWSLGIEKVKTTPLGRYHVVNLVNTFQYLDAVVIDTPIIDPVTREAMNTHTAIGQRITRTARLLKYLDSAAESIKDPIAAQSWTDVSHAVRDDILGICRRENLPVPW